MPTDCISYQESNYFTRLIVDYLDKKTETQSLYHRFPTLENFRNQLEEKAAHFSSDHRNKLADVLEKQYAATTASAATLQNITLLKDENTFTITTGHQLNLFTGPLYFLYKIISTINLTKELKAAYPTYHFVPVYWMATEDHDFEEINYFNFKSKKIKWNRDSSGPVGRLSTEGLDSVFDVFSKELGIGNNAESLRQLFKNAYLKHTNLADATRYLANELFKEQGLVIIDGDNEALKREFIPYVKQELLEQTSFQNVTATSDLLKAYNIQVNPREINLFYIEDQLRERIVYENGKYFVNGTSRWFTTEEILDELERCPEKFSPNVIMRPLYQEVILPNLAYIGGGGELAYWLELKSFFEASGIPFPILLLRNSALLATQKQAQKADKLGLSWADLFKKQPDLINEKVAGFSEFTIDFSEQRAHLEQQFAKLREIANQTDPSFSGAVNAQEKKQLKGLDNLEKRLLKAEKRNHHEQLSRITSLQNELFPNQNLQERIANFSEFYLEYGENLIPELFRQLKPLEQDFTVITL
ncbi:bacillithiol biosynthesis cysteine-adding enzyme BshC [Flavobacterium cerinum]|uniref:Putative cysteine ligase BshC n=1 Tax=Flavobacterium cerinum TaxID=2502784 RepID=A0ABY5IWL7_9FLAO|nr:bacillithiol biosynthesis cysteine-adding enzyme BshC [Flavobacterium cerinum]UUC47243.1 bacillithiol biosynthesis cysteine-adding enzyme BshC [Flavobacterium cerinum]